MCRKGSATATRNAGFSDPSAGCTDRQRLRVPRRNGTRTPRRADRGSWSGCCVSPAGRARIRAARATLPGARTRPRRRATRARESRRVARARSALRGAMNSSSSRLSTSYGSTRRRSHENHAVADAPDEFTVGGDPGGSEDADAWIVGEHPRGVLEPLATSGGRRPDGRTRGSRSSPATPRGSGPPPPSGTRRRCCRSAGTRRRPPADGPRSSDQGNDVWPRRR